MSLSDVVRTYIVQSEEGTVVSSEDLQAQFPEYSIDSIHAFLHSPKVQHYLVDRHNLLPPPKKKSRRTLTDEQRMWLTIVTNPYTTASINGLVARANQDRGFEWMSLEKHRRWMKQPTFAREYKRLLTQDVKATEGEAIRRTATKAMQGDTKAIELYYRMKGEPLPSTLAGSGQGAAIGIDVVMQVMQIVCTPEQLAKAAMLFQNPGQLELTQTILEADGPSAGDSPTSDDGLDEIEVSWDVPTVDNKDTWE